MKMNAKDLAREQQFNTNLKITFEIKEFGDTALLYFISSPYFQALQLLQANLFIFQTLKKINKEKIHIMRTNYLTCFTWNS